MATDRKEPRVESIKALLRSTERALEPYQGIHQWMWDNVVAHDCIPETMPEPVATHLSVLVDSLTESHRLTKDLFYRLCEAPLVGWLQGRAITREQFYLLRADDQPPGSALAGPKEQGLSDLDDYDLFRFQWYEEDGEHSYIDVRLEPGRRAPHRRAPEECRRRCLRPDQLAFFRDQLPEVFERFRQD